MEISLCIYFLIEVQTKNILTRYPISQSFSDEALYDRFPPRTSLEVMQFEGLVSSKNITPSMSTQEIHLLTKNSFR